MNFHVKKTIVPAAEFLAANLTGREGSWGEELPRLIDPMCQEILNVPDFATFLGEAGPNYTHRTGFLGEVMMATAAIKSEMPYEILTGTVDLTVTTPNGIRRIEVKARATANAPTIFTGNFHHSQLEIPSRAGAHYATTVQFDRMPGDGVGTVLMALLNMRRVRALHRRSRQFGKSRYSLAYDYTRGSIAAYLGLLGRPLTIDQVVRDLRNMK